MRISPKTCSSSSSSRVGLVFGWFTRRGQRGKKRLSRLELVLMVLAGVMAVCTTTAFLSILGNLPAENEIFHLFDRAEAEMLAEMQIGGAKDPLAVRAGGGNTDNERRKGGKQHKKGEVCFRRLFKFYTNLTSSANVAFVSSATLSPSSSRNGRKGERDRSSRGAMSHFLTPAFDSWVTHGETRYANNVNLEVDASNRSVIYAAWQASNSHEGSKDQTIQLAITRDRGRRWRTLPGQIMKNHASAGGFVPVWSPVLHSRRNGELLVFYSQSRSKCKVKGRSDWFTPGGDIYFSVSRDQGQTFEEPKVAYTMRKAPIIITSDLVVMKDGKREVWILPVTVNSKTTCASSVANLYDGPGIVYSKNYGRSWNFTESLPPSFNDEMQKDVKVRDGSIIQADKSSSSGKIIQLHRTGQGRVYMSQASHFGKQGHWLPPRRLGVPNPDSKLAAMHSPDGTLVLAYNNSTRKGHLSSLMISQCFDHQGVDWTNVALIEESSRSVYANPSMVQLHQNSANKMGPVLVAYSVAETVFGHFHAGVYQYRGIKLSSVNLNLPRLHVRRGRQAISFRSSKLLFDMSADEEKKTERKSPPAPPCLSLHHPSLFSLFQSTSVDRAEVKASIGMQLKVKPGSKQVKGKAMYTGLGTDDSTELYFNAESNVTHRLVALKGCSKHCTMASLERQSVNLFVLSGVFASNPDTDEYESPVLSGFRMSFTDGSAGSSKVLKIDVDAEKKRDSFFVDEELRLVINRNLTGGESSSSSSSSSPTTSYSYGMDVYLGEDHLTSFSWRDKQPAFLSLGCSRSFQGSCTPRGVGLCGRNIATKYMWHVQDLSIETHQNPCK